MSIRSALLPLAVAATLLSAQPAAAQSARRPRVAILDVRALGIAPEKAQALSEVALTEASNITGLDVIGRSDIQAMIGFEKEKQMLGCSDDSKCMTEIAGAMGVDWILVGSLGQFDALYRLDLKLIDAKRSRIAGRIGESIEGSQARLVSTVQAGVHKLLDPIAAAAAAAPPPVATRPAPPPVATRPAPPPPVPSRATDPAPPPPAAPAPEAAPSAAAPTASPAAPEAPLGRRWSAEFRFGASKLSGGSAEPAAIKPSAIGETDLLASYHRNRRWSFYGAFAYYAPSTRKAPVPTGGLASISLSGFRLSAGAAWAPAGNRYFSLAGDLGLASMAAEGELTIPAQSSSQRRTGVTVGVELRLDYPIGERWWVGARTGSRIALVGFGLEVVNPASGARVKLENDVGFVPIVLAAGYRF